MTKGPFGLGDTCLGRIKRTARRVSRGVISRQHLQALDVPGATELVPQRVEGGGYGMMATWVIHHEATWLDVREERL